MQARWRSLAFLQMSALSEQKFALRLSVMNCERCGKPANRKYARAGREIDLCDRCLDRYEIQDAYEARFPELVSLINEKAYEKAVALLDQVRAAAGDRDHEGWLENSILSDRALIFEEQGRLNEALDLYRVRAENGFQENSDYLAHQLAVAGVLDQLDKPAEAIKELESGLNAAQDNGVPTALSLFVLYARIAGREGWNVPVNYQPLLESTLERWGIEIDEALLDQTSSLAAAINAADAANIAAQARYQKLLEQLGGPHDDPDINQRRTALLRAYIEQEPVGLYRQMAGSHDKLTRK